MIPIAIQVGKRSYTGLFASTIDAILDAMERFGFGQRITAKALGRVANQKAGGAA